MLINLVIKCNFILAKVEDGENNKLKDGDSNLANGDLAHRFALKINLFIH